MHLQRKRIVLLLDLLILLVENILSDDKRLSGDFGFQPISSSNLEILRCVMSR